MKELSHQQCHTSLPEQTLLGNVKMDADGGGTRPASIMMDHLKETILLFASQGTFLGAQDTCLKFTLMHLHVYKG